MKLCASLAKINGKKNLEFFHSFQKKFHKYYEIQYLDFSQKKIKKTFIANFINKTKFFWPGGKAETYFSFFFLAKKLFFAILGWKPRGLNLGPMNFDFYL